MQNREEHGTLRHHPQHQGPGIEQVEVELLNTKVQASISGWRRTWWVCCTTSSLTRFPRRTLLTKSLSYDLVEYDGERDAALFGSSSRSCVPINRRYLGRGPMRRRAERRPWGYVGTGLRRGK